MKKALLVMLFLLVMVALGAGSNFLMLHSVSALSRAEHISTQDGPPAAGRLREFGQYRNYASLREVKSATVSGERTTEWFTFTAEEEDIAGLAEAMHASGPYRVREHDGRMRFVVHRAGTWQYGVPLPGSDTTSGGPVPHWWKSATLAGADCYLANGQNDMKKYVIYHAATKRGYLIVCW